MSLFEDDKVGPALERTARQIDQTGSALVRGLRAAATGAASIAFTPLALGIGALTVGVVGLAGALRIATNEANLWGRAIASLRANQGLTATQSFGLASRNSLFGISPQQTAQMYGAPGMNPMFAGIHGAATGMGNPYAANFLETASTRYQALAASGPMGRMFANAQLNATFGGQAPDEVRQAVNLRPSQIRSQLAYGAGVQAQMGISPEILRRYSEEIPLASQRIAFAVNQAKIKLAVELAPAIENGVGTVATLLAKNAGKIAGALERSVHFLIFDMPPLLLRGGAGILRGGAALLEGISGFAKGLAGNVRPMLTVFDAIINGVQTFAQGLGNVVSFVIGVVSRVGAAASRLGIPQALGAVGSAITQRPNDTPEDTAANTIVGGVAANAVLPTAAAIITNGMRGRGAAGVTGGASGQGPGMFYRMLTKVGLVKPYLGPGGSPGIMGRLLPLLRSPQAIAGTLLGVGGYEAMRHYDVMGYGSMPSTAQILGHYSGLTPSPTQQAAAAHAAQQARANGAAPFAGMAGMNFTRSNLAGNSALLGGLEQLFGSAGNQAGNGARSLLGLADKAEGAASTWKSEREAEMTKILREIANNTGKEANKDSMLMLASFMRDMMGRVMAYMAEDAALNTLRIG